LAREPIFEGDNDPRRKLLAAATERLVHARTFAGVMAVVRSTARAVMSADGVSFVLRDGDKCHYVEEDAVGPLWMGQRFPMSACISGWCMLNGRTAAIEDIYADPRIPHDAYRPTFVKSLAMAPVGRDPSVAAIGAYWRDRRMFEARELAAIEMLAASVAQAIQKTGVANP
jgi:GAF domain-containing protein